MLHTDIPQPPSPNIHLGCAGWNIRREHTDRFAAAGTHLQRYAGGFNAVEINSCFYRPHRRATYERWAASVPEGFRFSVKLPKAITHAARLLGITDDLTRFLDETSGLGEKRGPILVQLPPSFACDPALAESFFGELRARFEGDVAFEPRHESWFSGEVDAFLKAARIARVAADPARVPIAAAPGGWENLVYNRLHGSPRVYYSAYPPEYLEGVAGQLADHAYRGARVWCIFDNTALGAATSDALAVQSHLLKLQVVGR
ncbi:MAG TPA: DUF72 domain-containing protein [Gemmatimonadaceae bacterium]